jgi:DNA-binding NtrC family response regulator
MNQNSQPIRCLVVDDEMPARQAICRQIEKYCPHFQIVQTASSAAEAYQLIRDLAPEVVFLDIQMPHESGLELLDRFKDRSFYVVFCTTYHEYAVEALRKRAFDYLLKPVDGKDLIACAKQITHKLRVQPEDETPKPGGATGGIDYLRTAPFCAPCRHPICGSIRELFNPLPGNRQAHHRVQELKTDCRDAPRPNF